MFFGPIGKTRWPPWASDWLRHFLLLLWNYRTESNETKIGINISTSSTKFVFFGPIGKTRWRPWPLIGWDIFDFFSETAEWNSTKLKRKQDLNVPLPSLCFSGRSEKQDGLLASHWLRHFRLLLWNHGTEFHETWQEQDLNDLYQVCVFQADRKNKMAARVSDWVRDFWLLLWKSLNGVQRNLTRSKISTSSTKCVFFGLNGKTRWPPWPLIGWEIFRLLLWNRWTKFNKTWQEARSQCLLPRLCFSSRRINKNCCPGRSSVKKVAHCTQVHDMWPFGPLVWTLFQPGHSVSQTHVFFKMYIMLRLNLYDILTD